MSEIITVGLDLAKNVFQAHGADARGAAVLRKKLRRAEVLGFFAQLPPCLVAMEACGGAHFWGRELAKPGHDIKLIPPAYVKPFVKRQKNDTADAEAICEAARHALRAREERGNLGRGQCLPRAGAADQAAHPGDQRAPRTPGRVRLGRAAGRDQCPAARRDTGGQGVGASGNGAGLPDSSDCNARAARRADRDPGCGDRPACQGKRGRPPPDDDHRHRPADRNGSGHTRAAA